MGLEWEPPPPSPAGASSWPGLMGWRWLRSQAPHTSQRPPPPPPQLRPNMYALSPEVNSELNLPLIWLCAALLHFR